MRQTSMNTSRSKQSALGELQNGREAGSFGGIRKEKQDVSTGPGVGLRLGVGRLESVCLV